MTDDPAVPSVKTRGGAVIGVGVGVETGAGEKGIETVPFDEIKAPVL
jgi:hypothetical protein